MSLTVKLAAGMIVGNDIAQDSMACGDQGGDEHAGPAARERGSDRPHEACARDRAGRCQLSQGERAGVRGAGADLGRAGTIPPSASTCSEDAWSGPTISTSPITSTVAAVPRRPARTTIFATSSTRCCSPIRASASTGPTSAAGLRQLVFMPNSDALAAATQFLVQGALTRWLDDVIAVQRVECVLARQRADGRDRVHQAEHGGGAR